MLKLKIDPEFQQKIPPLTEDEYRQLEENILKAGMIYNPIVTWNGFILDGHNRYKIWQEHPDIPEPTTACVDDLLEDRWAALEWICKNQLGRRNLNDFQKEVLIGLAYEARKKRAGGQIGNTNAKGKNDSAVTAESKKAKKGSTCEDIAKELHTTPSLVDHAYRFVSGLRALEEISPGITDKILSGETGVTKYSVREIKRNSPDEQVQFAEAIISGSEIPNPLKMPSRLKLKKEQKSNPEPAPVTVTTADPEPVSEPEPDPDAAYLPDYTVQMLKDEILANFTSYLNSSGLLLEWHGNLLADKNAKNKIIELINFQIHELKKVRKEIDEKF